MTPGSSSQTPPPLHSSSGRDSSVDSTPVSTPVTAALYRFPRRSSRDPDPYNSWHRKPSAHTPPFFDHATLNDDLLFQSDDGDDDDDDEASVPLFARASPRRRSPAMTGAAASPLDIASMRQASSSPRNQQSNLTSQLQRPSIDIRQDSSSSNAATIAPAESKGRQESVTNMLSTTPYGARAIPLKDRGRRESNFGHAGSMANGMSWGGMSMGSFIRDDILMAGTSPYGGFQSPSFHSSSYLPKMEANYMRDYVCCDIKLDSMHELLQHYEEAHAAQPTQTMGRTPQDKQYPSSRAANATSTAQAVQQQAHAQQIDTPQQTFAQPQQDFQNNLPPNFNNQPTHEQLSSFDNLEDMEMDDGTPAPQVQQPQGSQFQPQPQFGRQQARAPSLNVNIANAFQGQGMRSATPSTPHASQGFGLQNNPTVSSVNTPTLSNATASQQITSPEASMPGTPVELDPNFLAQLGDMNNFDYNQLMQGNFDLSNLNLNNNGGSGTIDNPEKRLLSKQGYGNKGFANPAFASTANTNANANASNSELAKRVREAQLLNGLAGVGGFVGEEIKPFKCPVIGCEKAYKNQNGLKYHKQHGHQNQQLKENPDGTFSIVDPATSIPYPGTVGMEKEKPYRCEVCGKRYKNLNGLKYHRQHSPPCNPDFKLNTAPLPGMQNSMQGMNVNVAGAGMVQNGMTGL